MKSETMNFKSEVGRTYRVTGKDIGAWKDYNKPKGNNPHSRGSSVSSAKFSLEGRNITVKELVHQTDVGTVAGSKEYAAFEIVIVTVEGKEGDYYAWVVYEGVEKIPFEKTKPEDSAQIKPFENKEENKEDFTVPAGSTTAVDSKSEKASEGEEPEYSKKAVSIALLDENKKIRKCNCDLLFIDTNLVETYVKIENGVGGLDALPIGQYKIILDNQKIEGIDVTSNAKGFSVFNPYFCRPGFVYQVAPQASLPILDNKPYASFWPSLYTGNNSFYSGVVEGATIFADPKTPNDAQVLGTFKPNEYFIFDEVLMHSKTQNRPADETVAFQFSKPGMEGKNLFTMLTTDTSIVPATAEYIHDGQPGLIQLRTETLLVRNVQSGPKERLYTPNGTAAQKEAKPEVTDIRWHLPDTIPPLTEKHNIRKLYHHSLTGAKEQLLGVCHKKGVQPKFYVKTKEPITNSFKFKVAFWPTEMITTFKAAPSRFKLLYHKHRLKKKDDTKKYLVFKDFTITSQNLAGDKYEVVLNENDFYDIVKELNIEINNTKIGISVLTDETPKREKYVTSKMFAYPVLQHIILFLPGLFGSNISVFNDLKNNVKEVAWHSVNRVGDMEIELLECRADGSPLREAIEEDLSLFESFTIAGLGVKTVYDIKNGVSKVNLDSNHFPKIYYDNSYGDRVKFLLCEPAPYDWRLPKPNRVNNLFFKDFPFLEHVYKQVEKAYKRIAISQKTDTNGNPLPIDAHFINKKFSLAGHSTGGVMMQGLLSIKDLSIWDDSTVKFSSLIHSAFYMNAPSLGAPKAEYMRTTGKGFESLVNPESLRQTASNLPIAYMLAPNQGYANVTGENWSRKDQLHRFIEIQKKYNYEVWPKTMYFATDAYNPNRDKIYYNGVLSELAKKYFEFWASNYTDTIPSYIFHLGCQDTYSVLSLASQNNLALDNKEKIQKDLDRIRRNNRHINLKIENFVKEFSEAESTNIVNWLKSKDVNSLYTHMRENWFLPRVASLENLTIFNISEETWHVYCFADNKKSINWMLIINYVGGIVHTYRILPNFNNFKIDNLIWSEIAFGDGTVPQISQLGLWYMLSKKSKFKYAKGSSHSNIYIFPQTPVTEASDHVEAANPKWVWEHVANVLQKRPPEYSDEIPRICQNANTTANQEKSGLDKPFEEEARGVLMSYLYDAANNPLPVDTIVTLYDINNNFIGNFPLEEPGKLYVFNLSIGDYKIGQITGPNDIPPLA